MNVAIISVQLSIFYEGPGCVCSFRPEPGFIF